MQKVHKTKPIHIRICHRDLTGLLRAGCQPPSVSGLEIGCKKKDNTPSTAHAEFRKLTRMIEKPENLFYEQDKPSYFCSYYECNKVFFTYCCLLQILCLL